MEAAGFSPRTSLGMRFCGPQARVRAAGHGPQGTGRTARPRGTGGDRGARGGSTGAVR